MAKKNLYILLVLLVHLNPNSNNRSSHNKSTEIDSPDNITLGSRKSSVVTALFTLQSSLFYSIKYFW